MLAPTDRTRAIDIVHELALAVRQRLPTAQPTLMGTAGIAVFLAYAEAASVVDGLDVEGVLVDSLHAASAMRLPIGLWTGCSGVRWAVDHLSDGDEARAIVARLDDAVEAALATAPVDMSFDLYSGLAGILLAYADDRSAIAARIMGAVLDRLVVIDWARVRDVAGCAHGFAGVIAGLARCVEANLDDDRARGLLVELVGRVVTTGHQGAEVCWCRGESGSALAVLSAARALQHPELEQRALEMALSPFQAPSEGPMDAMLCHGAAGLAHLCNRAYQATGNGELGERARDWMRRAMAAQQPGTGIAGFRSLRRKPALAWEDDATLLVGAAGLGLVLLAGATPQPPRWDRLIAADVC